MLNLPTSPECAEKQFKRVMKGAYMCRRKHHDDDDLMSFFLSIPELVLYYRSIDNKVPK